MEAIGGYFSLELKRGNEYYPQAIKLNTGRNALEYILLANQYKKIYLPYYTCDVILQPITKLGIEYEFYHINNNFEAIFEFNKIKKDQSFLYTNYFGLKDKYINVLSKTCNNLIIDNAQAFYSKPIENVDTFYSCRKFFGVPDGAYLFSNKQITADLKKDISYRRFEHLLKRIDKSAEDGYADFIKNDESLNHASILEMSNLTRELLKSIDYSSIASQRIDNFNYLHKSLKLANLIQFDLKNGQVPMIYPFYSDNLELRKKMIENKIYTATYWPNVLNLVNETTLEYKYSTKLIHLPIDQRLNQKELDQILKIITS